MVPSVADLESATLNAWPALQVAHDRLWLWRAAKGYSKRANSIHCLDPADGDDADARLERLAGLYRYNDLTPVFRVTPLTSPGALAALEGAGWQSFEPSRVLTMATPADEYEVRHRTGMFDPRDPEWFVTQGRLSGYNEHTLGILKTILDTVACENCGLLAYDDDNRPVAAALATVSNGIGVYLNVIVDPSARGQGFGRSVMGAALNWTRGAKARSSVIQVLGNNAAALGLYGSLGFAGAYDYHYRKPAA
jgi:ribosomal protein S18 acetylase RimI-like enzyme